MLALQAAPDGAAYSSDSQTKECRESYRPGLIFLRLPCLSKKLFIVPLGQVGGEILILIQAYQESRGQEGVERKA